jgi:hypothetical protein
MLACTAARTVEAPEENEKRTKLTPVKSSNVSGFVLGSSSSAVFERRCAAQRERLPDADSERESLLASSVGSLMLKNQSVNQRAK